MRQPLPMLLVAAVLMLTGGLFTMAHSASSAAGLLNVTGVRAQYVDLDGNLPHVDTTCHLINTDLMAPIVLRNVRVLGPGGRVDVLANLTSLDGTVLPPLGELRIPIDSSIPGLLPQTTLSAPGVRSVMITWEGSPESLNLTAVIERYPPSSVDRRAHIVADGYAVGL